MRKREEEHIKIKAHLNDKKKYTYGQTDKPTDRKIGSETIKYTDRHKKRRNER